MSVLTAVRPTNATLPCPERIFDCVATTVVATDPVISLFFNSLMKQVSVTFVLFITPSSGVDDTEGNFNTTQTHFTSNNKTR